MVGDGEVSAQACSLLYKDRKLQSGGDERTWRLALGGGNFANCVADLLVGAFHSFGGCAVNDGPSDRVQASQAHEVGLLEMVEAVGCIAHLLPLGSQGREHGDCTAVLEVVGQGRAGTVGAKAVNVDIRVLEVS